MKLFVAVLLVAAAAADRLENTYLPPNSAQTAGGNSNFLSTPKHGGATGAAFGGAPSGAGAAFGGASSGAGGAYGGASSGAGAFGGAPSGAAGAFEGHSGAGAVSAGAHSYSGPAAAQIAILKYNNENNGDGSYNYEFETENKIQQQESGHLKNAGSEAESVEAHGAFTFTAPDGQTFSVQYVADENGFQPQGAHLPTAPPVPEEILKALEQNAADEAAGIVDDGQYKPDPSEGIAGKKFGGAGSGSAAANGGYQY